MGCISRGVKDTVLDDIVWQCYQRKGSANMAIEQNNKGEYNTGQYESTMVAERRSTTEPHKLAVATTAAAQAPPKVHVPA